MGNPIRILIVDDDANLRKTLSDILIIKGFAPLTCDTGKKALEQVGQDKEIIVALIDLRLTDMSGLELVRGIKECSSQTECILLTGHASQATAIEAVNLGVYSYFQKPYDIDQLLLSIRHAIEKCQVRKTLTESQAQYHTFINATTDMAFLKDDQFRYLIVNETAASFFGKPVEEIIGKDDFELLPAIADTIRQSDERVLQINGLVTTIKKMMGRTYEFREFPVDLQDGRRGMGVYIRDITESRNAEAALRKSEAQYRLLADHMTDTIWLMDLDLQTTYISPSLEKFLGYSLDELQHLSLDQNLTPASFQLATGIFSAERSKLAVDPTYSFEHTVELEFYRKIGDTVWAECKFSVIRDENGEPISIMGEGRDITERKQAEEAVKQTEIRFQALIEQSADVISLLTSEGVILYESQAVSRVLGYQPDEMVGHSVFDFLHPNDYAASQESFENIFRHPQTPVTIELRYKRKDDTWAWMHATGTNLLAEPSVNAIVVNYHDITERKLTEEALRESEEHYRGAIAAAGLVPYVIDYDTMQFVFIGENILKLTGYSSEEITPTILKESVQEGHVWGPENAELTQEEAARKFRSGEVKNWGKDMRIYTRTGEDRWLSDVSVPLLNEFGKVTSAIGVLQDLTERKLAEEITRRRVAELEVLYENSLTISRLTDPRQIAQKMTDTLAQKLSWHHAAVRLYHPETNKVELLAFHQPDITPVAISREINRLQKITLNPETGLSGWVILHGQAVLCPDVSVDPRYFQTYPDICSGVYVPMKLGERILGCISVESTQPAAFDEQDLRLLSTMAAQAAIAIHQAQLYEQVQQYAAELEQRVADRTIDLQQANLDLSRAARMKDEFLASMSHELRTPLTGILGLSESLQLNTYGDLSEKQLMVLKNIENSGRHLLELINDILDLSKIEAGKFDLQIEPCSLAGVCQASLQMIKGMAQQKHQNTNFSIAPDSILVRADARRLKQMLVNLLSNAVKFTPEGGKLGVEVQGNQDEQRVRITVWDTGIGIKPEDLARLFQPFVQLDSSLSRQFAGTGLGLSLVQRMAVLHGGKVEVESVPGKGSRFTIVLPWETEFPRSIVPINKITKRLHRALIIDENNINAEQLARYLKNLGISSQIMTTALGAVDAAAKLAPSVIFVHLNLPAKSGLELLAELKMDKRTANISVIIMSVEERLSEAIALGAVGYLIKPFTQAELQTELQRVAGPPSSPESNIKVRPVVLLADDNEVIANVITDFLQMHDCEVIAVQNGAELLKSVETTNPDVLLIDIQMPGMDGLEVMQRIRSHSNVNISALPMIAVTALAMSGDRERCIGAGANEYLSKPLQLAKLVEIIREFCK